MNIELFPAMGSAISRYIIEERPKGIGVEYVFVSEKAPYRKISPSLCGRIVAKVFNQVDSSYIADGLHCPRAIRRSLVSGMIAKGIPAQRAAAAIGHIGDTSVDLYTELEIDKMRSVCLPIPTTMTSWLLIDE